MLGSTRSWFGSVIAVGLLLGSGCGGPRSVEVSGLPPARVTLEAVKKRLGQSKKPGDLTTIALKSSRVLRELTGAERSALGRSSIRFRVDRPVVVEVATPESSEPPFWISDQGFEPTGEIHDSDGARFLLHAREFPAGEVGLGVNSLDRSSDAHYAVFVQGAGVTSGPVQITAIGPDPIIIKPTGIGVSPFEDVDRPIRDLPVKLRSASMVLTRQADRTDGALLPFGRAWKTRQPSSPRPDQVVASLGIDPTRSLSITWRTNPSVVRSSARFVPESSLKSGFKPIIFQGDSQPIDSDGLLNDPNILRHRVNATGLQPDTRYAYSVGDGSEQGWSEWYSIRTAPNFSRDYSFLYLGDAQNELERWGDLAHSAVKARPEAGFMILAGDLVDRGNERSNWDHFFLRAVGVFDAIPLMPAVGNHEYLDKGPEIYRKTFDLPKNGPEGVDPNLVYCFEYADAFVAVLDSNLAIYNPEAAKGQADWLDRALGETRATWKFVAFHHPVYASHPSRANPQLGQAWGPVFDKHHVDLVLTGHDHAYLRSKPMKGGHPVEASSEGTTYIVAVSGEKFYGQDPHDYTAKGLTHVATYQTIDVEVASRRLHYRSFDRSGREIDALTIDKPADGRLTPPELAGLASPIR